MRQYIAPIIRWWWLILAATALAAVFCFVAVSRQAPVYEVRATLAIGRSFSDPNPNSGELYLEQQLATVYANLGTRSTIASATMKALGLDGLPQYYVRTVPNTPLMEIIVSDTDPARAVAVANELANQIIGSSPTSKEQQDKEQQNFIKDQLQKIQDQIKTTESDITAAQEKLGNLTGARQISDAQTQITALQQKLLALQSNYANLLQSSQTGAVNAITLVQAAEPPAGPVGANKLIYVVLAAALGMAISTAAAYGWELLDNTYKSEEEVTAALNFPVIGKIPTISSTSENHWSYCSHHPRSPVADAFRILRTNLEFIAVGKPLRSILIAGPDLSMGKSVIASNLAIIFSQGEKKVILVDADLRRPKLASALEVEKTEGISDICLERTSMMESLIPWKNGKKEVETILKSEGVEAEDELNESKPPEGNLPSIPLFYFLPAGTIPPNPAEILSSSRYDQLMTDLIELSNIVFVDSPPLFLPDASVLLRKVDGVILIIELGRTSKKAIKMAIEQIHRSGANLIGLVLNRTGKSETYYSKYNTKYSLE